MTPKECYDAWEKIKKIYRSDVEKEDNPLTTVTNIVKEIGVDNTYTVFSTIAESRKWDGRIYGRTKEKMMKTPYIEECVCRGGYENKKWLLNDIDSIHMAVINQLIGCLMDNEKTLLKYNK